MRFHVWPRNRAMAMPIRPEMRKRTERENKGGASTTIMRAEVKAELHMKAKARPMKSALKSIGFPLLARMGADGTWIAWIARKPE
mgnify:CR=1 FL=1